MSQYINLNIPTPFRQALLLGASSVVFMLVGRYATGTPSFAWTSSCAFMLFFIVFNNAAGIFADNFGKYVQQSLPVFAGLLLTLGLFATLISGLDIRSLPAFRTIYIVVIFANFSLLALCFLVRRVADFLRDRDEA